MPVRILLIPYLAIAISLGGCVAAAAGAGAAGAVYVIDRGVESTITADVPTTERAAKQTFRDMGIAETRTRTEEEGGAQKRIVEGKRDDREITVSIGTPGNRSKVPVLRRT